MIHPRSAQRADRFLYPAFLLREVHTTGCGELLWPLTIAEDVISYIMSRTALIYGGEVYACLGPARTVFIDDWTVAKRKVGEPWRTFTERSGHQAADTVRSSAAAVPGGGADASFFFDIGGADTTTTTTTTSYSSRPADEHWEPAERDHHPSSW